MIFQRIYCLFGRHVWRPTHTSTGKRGDEIIYKAVTDACWYCGKHGERRVLIDKRKEGGE